MSHDISRDSYGAGKKRYAKVRRLQGRLFTDADYNEGVDEADRQVRDFIADLIGPHAAPKRAERSGFKLGLTLSAGNKLPVENLTVSKGAYYLDGVRAWNPNEIDTKKDPLAAGVSSACRKLVTETDQLLLFYLDVWNDPVTPLDDPDLIDRGYGGRESCNRERWVWMLRAAVVAGKDAGGVISDTVLQGMSVTQFNFQDPLTGPRTGDAFGRVRFAVGAPTDTDDGCAVAPEAFAYTGPMSQHYRLQVHWSGTVGAKRAAQFKWSRDNAAPALGMKADTWVPGEPGTWKFEVESLEALGGQRVLEPLHWVEPILPGSRRLPLLWVETVDLDTKQVVVSLGSDRPQSKAPDDDIARVGQWLKEAFDRPKAPDSKAKLTLWDHTGGDYRGLPAKEIANPAPASKDKVPGLVLEHGVRAFVQTKTYLAGEYWLFPARPGFLTITEFAPPDGPEHLYAPLMAVKSDGKTVPLRRTFNLDAPTDAP